MMINRGMWHHIVTHCQSKRGVLLELGSGETSAKFVEYGLKVYSVEHDEKWLGKYPGVNYIHAPLVPYEMSGTKLDYFTRMNCEALWYDPKILKKQLPLHYDALLLDGPTRPHRIGFGYFWNLFRSDVPWFADDMSRPEWFRVMLWVVRDRGIDTFPPIYGIDTPHAWCKVEVKC